MTRSEFGRKNEASDTVHEAADVRKASDARDTSLKERLDQRIDITATGLGKKLERSFDPDERVEILYSTPEQRKEIAGRTGEEYARFEGELGNSRCYPNLDTEKGRLVGKKLAEFGQKYIEYKNGVVDFSPASKETVTIEGMTADRTQNFRKAVDCIVDKWNAEKSGGRDDWKPSDVKQWKRENNLEFHECSDMKTCQFVAKEIHQAFRHAGGRFECSIRDGVREVSFHD